MKLRRVLVAVLMTAASFVAISDSPAANVYPSANVSLSGHGFGHGRGLSQYGALGYAVDHSWSWQQILDHFYGGTSFGAGAPNLTIGVRFLANEPSGGLPDTIVSSASPFTAGSQSFGGGEATLIRRIGANNFSIWRGPGCAGPWNQIATQSGPVTVTPSVLNQGDNLNYMLQLCQSAGQRGVRGTVTALDDGGQHTINSLPVEEYLKGVVPRESPASWGDLGGGKGANALRAQAVAARSYVLASSNYSYATTCETTACQVYGGAFLNGTRIEDDRTNAAIAATAGAVRRFSGGAVARTEFSSSSGGYSAGGTFTAVVDDGDDYSGNSNHNWSVDIPVSTVEAAFPAAGSLQTIQVNSRNGLGDFGGRVLSVTLSGTGGSVTTTGSDFRTKLGTSTVKSDWFQVLYTASGGVEGYWLMGNDGGIFSFGAAQFYGSMGGRPLNKPVVTLTPNADSAGYWLTATDGGVFSFGSSRFHGSMGGRPLNKPIVGMAVTPSSNGYWEVGSDGGIFAFGDATFYGSMGGKPLNRPIVDIAVTPSGNGYWLVASDGGLFAYGDANFFGSTGSLALRQPVVGMSATPTGNGYWMVAADGGIFAFGDAGYFGSLPGSKVSATVTGMASTVTGSGYMVVTTNGTVYSFGDAPQFGNLGAVVPGYRGTILAIAPSS